MVRRVSRMVALVCCVSAGALSACAAKRVALPTGPLMIRPVKVAAHCAPELSVERT